MPAEEIALSGRMNLSDLIEPTLINGKHTYEESSFFIRGDNIGRIPDEMKVEHVLDVFMPEVTAVSKAA